jgi:hypothetical protein
MSEAPEETREHKCVICLKACDLDELLAHDHAHADCDEKHYQEFIAPAMEKGGE